MPGVRWSSCPRNWGVRQTSARTDTKNTHEYRRIWDPCPLNFINCRLPNIIGGLIICAYQATMRRMAVIVWVQEVCWHRHRLRSEPTSETQIAWLNIGEAHKMVHTKSVKIGGALIFGSGGNALCLERSDTGVHRLATISLEEISGCLRKGT